MGIGDSIEEAAKNAVEDLAGTADRTDDGHAPEPGESPGLGKAAAHQDVPGPGGLPTPDPGDLRADPSEADGDPSTSMGRG